jgi:hypothetical protein
MNGRIALVNEERKATWKILGELEEIEGVVRASVNKPHEGETRSVRNEELAIKLGEFGVKIALVNDLTRTAEDRYGQLKAEAILTYAQENPVNKAELLAKTDTKVIEALGDLRTLEHAADVLGRKYKSIYAFLENSRSRLSWIGKDRANA